MYPPETVIEIARKAAGTSQAQLSLWAGTQQSSISEHESRRRRAALDPLLDSDDGILLMQVWERLHLPTVTREAW